MKRVLLLVLPVLLVVTAVFAVYGFVQVRVQEERLIDDLQRKAKNVAESMELSARMVFSANNVRMARELAGKFQTRDQLQGCIFYDRQGKILAVTERIAEFHMKDPTLLNKVLATAAPRDTRENYRDHQLYSYLLPVNDDHHRVLGVLEVTYDTSYINDVVTDLWKRTSITLAVLTVLIVFIIFVLQRHIFVLPVHRLTDWFQRFHRGETDGLLPMSDIGELGKLASEVEQAALGLRVARRSVSLDAIERIRKDESWDEQKLKDLVRAKLGGNPLFLVSNREPYMHVLDEATGEPKCVRPASGVVTALDPVMRACGGVWIAQSSGNADAQFVNSKDKLGVPPDDIHYIMKRVWLTKEEEQGYYYGFSNEGLWPLCHITYTRPQFSEADWQMYRQVNRKFADSLLEELPAKNPLIFIQDYHFTLLPKMIKEKRPDAVIVLFWHIPWPNPEVFSVCPYQEEILEGMLGCDLIGFHVQYHCNNFMETVNRMLECRVNTERFSIVRAGKETLVRAFPISVDTAYYADAPDLKAEVELLRKEHGLDEDMVVGVGVERIDYTKGIVERMQAIDRFLDKYPQYKGRFTFIQLGAPSRTHIKRYLDLVGEIDAVVEQVNWKHSSGAWKPVIYMKRQFSAAEIRPYYALADLCVVSSLHDGMNLVAKEYVASKHDLNGALVLSCFTGAARELADAIQVNPYATEKFADALFFAAEMPAGEKARRMKNMRRIINENNVYRWAGSIISDLTALRKDEPRESVPFSGL